MDTQFDVEVLRSKLQAMPWTKAMKLAREAGVSTATVTHFRMGRIKELGGFKAQALHNALVREPAPAPKARRQAKAAA